MIILCQVNLYLYIAKIIFEYTKYNLHDTCLNISISLFYISKNKAKNDEKGITFYYFVKRIIFDLFFCIFSRQLLHIVYYQHQIVLVLALDIIF